MAVRKTREQIRWMRAAGRVVAEMHEACTRAATPGATTRDLERAACEVLDARGATSNFRGYRGFPAVACISPNEVVVHGIPGDRRLAEGDIVSIDCGAVVRGWHADAAVTVPVGEVDAESRRLIDVTAAALAAAIDQMWPDRRLGDLGAACERAVDGTGFAIVREYAGHGIGTAMHEEPEVPNRGVAGRGLRLREGIVLAIEPMLTTGRRDTRVLADGWTVVTADGSRSAHFEHTVAVTANGPEILTVPEAGGGPQPGSGPRAPASGTG